MGLEKHADQVLGQAGFERDSDYFWDHGLKVYSEDLANSIMKALDDSGEFGPTRWSDPECKIHFGEHRMFFKNSEEYEAYEEQFKAWKVD